MGCALTAAIGSVLPMTAGWKHVRQWFVDEYLIKCTSDIAIALYIGWLDVGNDCRVVSSNIRAHGRSRSYRGRFCAYPSWKPF
jgi:hypothetical protein